MSPPAARAIFSASLATGTDAEAEAMEHVNHILGGIRFPGDQRQLRIDISRRHSVLKKIITTHLLILVRGLPRYRQPSLEQSFGEHPCPVAEASVQAEPSVWPRRRPGRNKAGRSTPETVFRDAKSRGDFLRRLAGKASIGDKLESRHLSWFATSSIPNPFRVCHIQVHKCASHASRHASRRCRTGRAKATTLIAGQRLEQPELAIG